MSPDKENDEVILVCEVAPDQMAAGFHGDHATMAPTMEAHAMEDNASEDDNESVMTEFTVVDEEDEEMLTDFDDNEINDPIAAETDAALSTLEERYPPSSRWFLPPVDVPQVIRAPAADATIEVTASADINIPAADTAAEVTAAVNTDMSAADATAEDTASPNIDTPAVNTIADIMTAMRLPDALAEMVAEVQNSIIASINLPKDLGPLLLGEDRTDQRGNIIRTTNYCYSCGKQWPCKGQDCLAWKKRQRKYKNKQETTVQIQSASTSASEVNKVTRSHGNSAASQTSASRYHRHARGRHSEARKTSVNTHHKHARGHYSAYSKTSSTRYQQHIKRHNSANRQSPARRQLQYISHHAGSRVSNSNSRSYQNARYQDTRTVSQIPSNIRAQDSASQWQAKRETNCSYYQSELKSRSRRSPAPERELTNRIVRREQRRSQDTRRSSRR